MDLESKSEAVTPYCGGNGSVVLSLFHLFSLSINGKQGVNSLICACRTSNCVYLLVFTIYSVGLHAHKPAFRSAVHYILTCRKASFLVLEYPLSSHS